MCNCKKGVPANKINVQSAGFRSNGSTLRVGNNDFVTKYYIGETGEYIGSSTGINYGVRTHNTKTMVHAEDYSADSHLFSDEEYIKTRTVEEPIEVETVETEVEEVETTQATPKKRRKKEVEENVETDV